jgi:5-methylcytosine-specific restriction endonuclease McrA
MTKLFDDNEVRLPWDDVLLPWALEHDPEAAQIILAVQAKGAKRKVWGEPKTTVIPAVPTKAATPIKPAAVPAPVKKSPAFEDSDFATNMLPRGPKLSRTLFKSGSGYQCNACGKWTSTIVGPVPEANLSWLCSDCAEPIHATRRTAGHDEIADEYTRTLPITNAASATINQAVPRVVVVKRILPEPEAEALEEHTESLNEHDDLAAYVASRSSRSAPTPQSVLPDVAIRQATGAAFEETHGQQSATWRLDTDSEKSSSAALETKELTEPRSYDLNNLTQLPALELPVAPALSVSKRKPPVRLSDKERETALRLGLKSPVAPTYRTSSVLDDYEPVARPGRRSPVPSKNLLIKWVVAQNEECGYCDRLFGSMALIDGNFVTLKAEPDHFTPRAKRLNNSPSNIVAACQVCNGLKSSRSFTTIEQARAVLQAAWAERGWNDAPLLVPYKLTMPLCLN